MRGTVALATAVAASGFSEINVRKPARGLLSLPTGFYVTNKEYDQDEPLIGVEKLAAWLGVSKHTVKKWVTAGAESHKISRVIPGDPGWTGS